MHVTGIPRELIAMVLQCVAAKELDTMENWACLFPLLGVCRHWRALALPIVYGHVNIYNQAHNRGNLAGNLGFVVHNGNMGFVNKVSVKLTSRDGIYPLLRGVLDQLAASGSEWRRVRTLDVNLWSYEMFSNSQAERSHQDGLMASMAQEFRHILPNVSRLYLNGHYGSIEHIFNGQLASIYASQVVRFSCLSCLPQRISGFSDHITSLQLTFRHDGETNVARMYSRTLRKLSLFMVPADYAWSGFNDGCVNKTIAFPRLLELNVNYLPTATLGPDRESPGAPQFSRLDFPRLQKLDLYGAPCNCAILTTGVFPPHMRRVYMCGTGRAAMLLHQKGLVSTEELSVSVAPPYPCSNSGFIQATNHLFGSVSISGDSSLLLSRSETLVDFTQAQWGNLGKLSIDSKISASMLLALITRAPKVWALTVLRVHVDTRAQDMAIHALQNCQVLESLCSSIERLDISFDPQAENLNANMPFLKYLVAQLTSLKTMIHAGPNESTHLQRFFASHKDTCPHLALVDILSY